jgi:hypothetical protein
MLFQKSGRNVSVVDFPVVKPDVGYTMVVKNACVSVGTAMVKSVEKNLSDTRDPP